MLRPAFWFCTFLAITCIVALRMPRLRVERAEPAAKSATTQAELAPEASAITRVKSKTDLLLAKLLQNDFDADVAVDEPVAASPVSKSPAEPQVVPFQQDDAAPVVTHANDEQQIEMQPALPPADSAKEIAAIAARRHALLIRESRNQPPAKLLISADENANPLRPEREPTLDPRMAKLKRRLGETLAYYRKWPVNTSNRSPWEVMHAAIAFGCESQLQRDGDNQPVTALGHLCFNGICEGDSLLRVVDGRIAPRRGPGLQGHDGQLLAIIAQSKVKIDYPMAAYGHKFTVADLVEHEKRSVRSGTELTFQLIGLMHYLRGEEETWKNELGEDWSIRRILREEINSPVRGAACGGTHRMMAISYCIRKREQRGFKVTGQYKRARQYAEDYHRFTFGLQNPDGSFSTSWFAGREANNDIDLRMQTTGHIFEWLAFSLSDEQMRGEKMVRAAEYLTGLLSTHRQRDWKIGPLGHALHGLVLYEDRVFNKKPSDLPLAEPIRKSELTAMQPTRDKAVAPNTSIRSQPAETIVR